MKKRFFTFLMAVWALLSISQTVKATNTYYVRGAFEAGAWPPVKSGVAMTSKGNNTYVWEYKSEQDGEFRFRFTGDDFENEMCPYVTRTDLSTFSSTNPYGISTDCYEHPNTENGRYFIVNMKKGTTYVFTFKEGSSRQVWCDVNTSTTPSKFARLYVWGNISGSNWGENDFSREFTTSDGKTYQYVFGTDYTNAFSNNTADFYFRVKTESKQYAPQTNDDPVGTEYTSAKESSEGAWKLTMTKGKSYTLTFDYENMQIKYSEQGSGTVTPPSGENPIANRKYSKGYYLVGNFFNFDGDNINYKDAVFKFQQQKDDEEGNAVYMVEIPATLTAKAQVMSVDATGTSVAVYGPTKGYEIIGKTHPTVGVDHTAKLGPENLVESTEISETCGNFWNMKSRRESKTGDGQDGSYTYYITIDKDSHKPSLWTIKYDDMKRVAYYLSTDEKATAMTLNSVRNDVNGDFNAGKYQGTLYAQEGSEFYAISNAMRLIENENYIFAEYRDQVVNTENILSTYPKLFLWGNGGKPLGDTSNFIAATNGTFKLSNDVVGISSWEFNSNKGNNDDNSKYGNTGGQVLQKSTNKTITSISMVGPAIPGTTTGNEWDWASTVADMDFDVSENCYKLTIATTEENMNQVFRFVGNHTKEINWFENGKEAVDKAASYPYEDVSVGHKASPSDPNEVSYTQNGLSAEDKSNNDNLNILWNRPAGTWTVRFYIYTYSQNGNDPSFRYFYTISENRDLELRDFGDVVYKSETRNILKRGEYRYFRTWSDNKAWKRPKNVDVFVVSKTPAETSNGGFVLTKINNFDTSEDVIPANTGVILALEKDLVVPGAVFHTRKSSITYNTLVIPLEEATNKYLGYTSGDNHLKPLIEAQVVPTKEGNKYNYLFGFYRAKKVSENKDYKDNDFLLGFWISNGTGAFYSNSAYLPIDEATANKMNLGVSYNDFNSTTQAKKVPGVIFDFANVGGTTGINEVVNQSTKLNDGKYYTLSGQQVEKPTAGGIYIHNGRKFVVK